MMIQTRKTILSTALCLMLGACGGGGGNDQSGNDNKTNIHPTPPSQPSSISLSLENQNDASVPRIARKSSQLYAIYHIQGDVTHSGNLFAIGKNESISYNIQILGSKAYLMTNARLFPQIKDFCPNPFSFNLATHEGCTFVVSLPTAFAGSSADKVEVRANTADGASAHIQSNLPKIQIEERESQLLINPAQIEAYYVPVKNHDGQQGLIYLKNNTASTINQISTNLGTPELLDLAPGETKSIIVKSDFSQHDIKVIIPQSREDINVPMTYVHMIEENSDIFKINDVVHVKSEIYKQYTITTATDSAVHYYLNMNGKNSSLDLVDESQLTEAEWGNHYPLCQQDSKVPEDHGSVMRHCTLIVKLPTNPLLLNEKYDDNPFEYQLKLSASLQADNITRQSEVNTINYSVTRYNNSFSTRDPRIDELVVNAIHPILNYNEDFSQATLNIENGSNTPLYQVHTTIPGMTGFYTLKPNQALTSQSFDTSKYYHISIPNSAYGTAGFDIHGVQIKYLSASDKDGKRLYHYQITNNTNIDLVTTVWDKVYATLVDSSCNLQTYPEGSSWLKAHSSCQFSMMLTDKKRPDNRKSIAAILVTHWTLDKN